MEKSIREDTAVIKIGGRAASEKAALNAFLEEMSTLASRYHFILVHGGGAEVSKVTAKFGLNPVFKDGIRMTTPEEMDIVDMVLAGKMNKYIVRMCGRYLPAVGLSGSDGKLFTGVPLACGDDETTCTGEITEVDVSLLRLLLENGYTPVISSTSMTGDGTALNINADEAALGVAAAIPAKHLVFLSDVPGILKNGKVIRMLHRKEVEEEITSGTIAGGMIPKVRSSVQALEGGVGEIIIGQYAESGDLKDLLEGGKGSTITLEKETI
jgi:acetylglutamate kinase